MSEPSEVPTAAPDPTPDPPAPAPPAPAPALVARGLALRTREGVVFEGVDVTVPHGALLSVHGPAGSGRTMLLLALCGRAAVTAGTVDGPDPRRRTALAATGGPVALEPALTVGAHERERRLLGPVRRPLDDVAALLGLHLDRDARVADLDRADAVLLAVAFAAQGDPDLVAADDVDAGLGAADLDRVGAALRALADSGTAVVTTSHDPLPWATAALAVGAASPVPGGRGRHEKP